MDKDTILNECKDPTQSITLELPCTLAERVQKLADENETTLTSILIEALDRSGESPGMVRVNHPPLPSVAPLAERWLWN